MEIVRDMTFINKNIDIDDKHFIDCSLIQCVLEYAGGDFTLERTLIKDCRHNFFGSARGTVHYLQAVGLLANEPGLWGELSAEVH